TYQVTGWTLAPDEKHVTFTDGCGSGRGTRLSTRALATLRCGQIQRVRLLCRVDGYHAPVVLQAERHHTPVPTGRGVGLEEGLHVSCTDSHGQAVANLRSIHHVGRLVARVAVDAHPPLSPCGLIVDRDHHAAAGIREAGVAQAIAHVRWDPVRHGLRSRGPGQGEGEVEGAWGTREPQRVGTAGLLRPHRLVA